jgi:hypothetical protein
MLHAGAACRDDEAVAVADLPHGRSAVRPAAGGRDGGDAVVGTREPHPSRADVDDDLPDPGVGVLAGVVVRDDVGGRGHGADGIHPAVLTDDGLPAALRSLAEHSAVPVTITTVPARRLPTLVEESAYCVVAERLASVVKHANANRALVEIRHDVRWLTVEVRDYGRGGAVFSDGSGLRGLTDRVAALDGRPHVHSNPGRGTRVIAELPCG